VLLDGSDPPDERRFSLAHEAGHFLADYQQPRRRLQASLGPSALAVLDGARAATVDERIDAILGDVDVEPRLHLMERDGDCLACGDVAGAECLADEIALELLAPEAVVLAMLEPAVHGLGEHERLYAAESLLRGQFGLPRRIAAGYAHGLLLQHFGAPATRDWLGLQSPRSSEAGEGETP